MYRPRISQLIEMLEVVKAAHGDLETQGYDNDRDTVFDGIDAEYNNDEGEFCLITLEVSED
jgi:hypothetical protein